MSKNRYINTKFWSDNFVVDLNPLDRYLFLYFLTNEHTDISGVYELPLRTMAYETGLEKEMLEKMIVRLEGKVYYLDGWVFIKNFAKHQADNDNVRKGISRSLSQVPNEIMLKIKEISKGYTYPIDSLSKTLKESELLNLNLDLDLTEELHQKFFSHPLLESLKKKYPLKDLDHEFMLMCDWWLTNKKKLPKAISAFSNWLEISASKSARTSKSLRYE